MSKKVPLKSDQPTTTSTSFLKSNAMPLLVLFLLGFGLYIYTSSFQYALDDSLYIERNEFTKNGLAGIKDIFTTESLVGFFGQQKDLVAGGRYRPLGIATFALEYQLFGLSPGLSHFINVLLYALTGCLIFYLLSRLLPVSEEKKWWLKMPFVITALWVAHPLHTEVVANIKGRIEMLGLLGALLTIYWAIRYLDTNKMVHIALIGITFFLALMSKEEAITFLAVVPMTLYFFTNANIKQHLGVMGPMAAATGLFLFIRYRVLGFFLGTGKEVTELLNEPFMEASVGEKYATIMYTWLQYFKLLFFPHPLTHDYYPKQVAIIGWSNIWVILSVIIVALMLIKILFGIFKKDISAYGFAFFFITFSIVSNLIFSIGSFMNERFLFIPSLGLIIGFVYLFKGLGESMIKDVAMRQKLATALIGIFVVGFSLRTLARIPAWNDNYSLFTTDVATSVNSSKANTSAGGVLLDKATFTKNKVEKTNLSKKAIGYLNRALEIYPQNKDALILLGNAYHDGLRDYGKTYDAYYRVLELKPEHPRIWKNIPMIAEMVEDPKGIDQTIQFLEKVVKEINPQSYVPYDELGMLYARKKNDLDKGIEYFYMALEKNPNHAGAFQDLGIIYGMQNKLEKGLEMSLKALELEPNNPKILLNVGITYSNMGQTEKGKRYMDQAATLDPGLNK